MAGIHRRGGRQRSLDVVRAPPLSFETLLGCPPDAWVDGVTEFGRGIAESEDDGVQHHRDGDNRE